MNVPFTFKDANSGEVVKFGVNTFITDKLLMINDHEILEQLSDLMSKPMAKYLIDNLLKHDTAEPLHLEINRDASLRGYEVAFIINGIKYEPNPGRYVYRAYKGWSEIYGVLMDWQKMSLWGYFKYWFRRTFIK